MGAKASSETAVTDFSASVVADGHGSTSGRSHGGLLGVEPGHHRPRARSFSGVGRSATHSFVIESREIAASDSTDEGPRLERLGGHRRRLVLGSSVPLNLLTLNGIKCPFCSKFMSPDDVELHLVLCVTKPRISYNNDVLTENRGECAICLDELNQGDTIARLPCLCIYHKRCIDEWFKVNRSCPEHPGD